MRERNRNPNRNPNPNPNFSSGDVRHLVDDIAALRPTLFLGVPRVFDRIYAGATAKIKVGETREKNFTLIRVGETLNLMVTPSPLFRPRAASSSFCSTGGLRANCTRCARACRTTGRPPFSTASCFPSSKRRSAAACV